MRRDRLSQRIDMLATTAARALAEHGSANPDYDEWKHLKNALLAVLPSLGKQAAETVGKACSGFIEARHKMGDEGR